MIELRHLRYFVVLGEELHFGRAAERLHMAQSPLSHQIRQLERELGLELVSRGHHVVGLTDAGQSFLQGARAVLDELDQAVHLTRRAGRGEVGTLSIGYVSEVTADLLPLSLKAFKHRHGDVEIELRESTTGQLLEGVRQRRVDVAFVRSPGKVGDLRYEQLIEETLVVAAPTGRLDDDRPASLHDLHQERFVLPAHAAAPGLRRDIEAACSAAGFELRVAREASPLTAVLLHVAARVGVALVPASVAHSYPVPGVSYAPLSDPPPATTAGMAWRPNDPSSIVGNFLAVTRDLARHNEGRPDVWPERHVVDRSES